MLPSNLDHCAAGFFGKADRRRVLEPEKNIWGVDLPTQIDEYEEKD